MKSDGIFVPIGDNNADPIGDKRFFGTLSPRGQSVLSPTPWGWVRG